MYVFFFFLDDRSRVGPKLATFYRWRSLLILVLLIAYTSFRSFSKNMQKKQISALLIKIYQLMASLKCYKHNLGHPSFKLNNV